MLHGYARKPLNVHAMTYEEIAKLMGITKQRVMQIEAEALKKLRHRLKQVATELK